MKCRGRRSVASSLPFPTFGALGSTRTASVHRGTCADILEDERFVVGWTLGSNPGCRSTVLRTKRESDGHATAVVPNPDTVVGFVKKCFEPWSAVAPLRSSHPRIAEDLRVGYSRHLDLTRGLRCILPLRSSV